MNYKVPVLSKAKHDASSQRKGDCRQEGGQRVKPTAGEHKSSLSPPDTSRLQHNANKYINKVNDGYVLQKSGNISYHEACDLSHFTKQLFTLQHIRRLQKYKESILLLRLLLRFLTVLQIVIFIRLTKYTQR